MQILARYIAGAYFRNLILSTSGLVVLLFFQSVITQVNDYTLAQKVIMNLYDLPGMWIMVAPPGVLMATILTLSALSKTHELVACYSIGIGMRQLMGVLFPIVFVFSCFSLVLQDRILPAVNEKKSLFYWKEIRKRQDFFLDVKQEKIWYRSNQYIYHLRNFDPEHGRIVGIGVYEFDDAFNLKEEMQAEEAIFRGGAWELKKGRKTTFNAKTGFPESESFASRELVIRETPKDFKMIEKEVDRLRIKDLLRFIRSNRQSGIDSKGLEVKLHSRFSLSFISIIMFLLAIPFAISRGREGRAGRDLSIAFAITFFYWLSNSISMSLGQNGVLPPAAAAWSPSVIFGFLALYLLRRMKV
ncbi:MAG: LPS export ABC transporter permease LptG [Bdellovibrionales bacterium]|nr:LPS export ABC transporter permease LptG [Bdellovibrionales bacterium]